MDIIDYFAFPTQIADEDGLSHLSSHDLKTCIDKTIARKLVMGVYHSMLVIFDNRTLYSDNHINHFTEATSQGNLAFAIMPKKETYRDDIARAAEIGFKSIVLHPYLQNFEPQSYKWVIDCAREAERKELIISLCCAYGGPLIYLVEPLQVVRSIADQVNGPIVIVHGGGAKILEALLLADIYNNIFLDTSFSLHWWIGSSIENDFAFAMKKLGSERWMFGSDDPFLQIEDSLKTHWSFFDRHGISSQEQENIMNGTAHRLLRLD